MSLYLSWYKDCHSKQKREGAYSFANCFICKQDGHLAKTCPDNPKGLYPKGGGCVFCGSVEHLKRDCKRKVEKDLSAGIKVSRVKADVFQRFLWIIRYFNIYTTLFPILSVSFFLSSSLQQPISLPLLPNDNFLAAKKQHYKPLWKLVCLKPLVYLPFTQNIFWATHT